MLGFHARIGLTALALVAAATVAPRPDAWAQTFGHPAEAGREKPPHGYDWRPAPPAVHGFWGQRRWQRYSDGIGERGVSPSSYGDARR